MKAQVRAHKGFVPNPGRKPFQNPLRGAPDRSRSGLVPDRTGTKEPGTWNQTSRRPLRTRLKPTRRHGFAGHLIASGGGQSEGSSS